MIKVTNISERSIVIAGKRIVPLQTVIFDENTLSETAKRKINTLADLGIITIAGIQQIQPSNIIETNDDNKKQVKKSK